MPSLEANTTCQWLRTGDEIFPEMLRAIDAARSSVSLETYLFAAAPLGERFREALVRAQQRGARVRVLIDAVGSIGLPEKFWESLRHAGGEVRWFNPLALRRFWFRNHCKLLACDGQIAFVGGFNIAPEFEGDGIQSGWRDIGLEIIGGPLAAQLEASFDEMFSRAEFRHKRFMRLLRSHARKAVASPAGQILLGGPGRGQSPIKRALHADLAQARDVQIIVAYFLPTRRLRRDLMDVARRGGKVRLVLAGKSDVLLSQLATQSFYRRFLKDGVEIYEYQPQILHAKLIILDDTVYVGSSNLDQRSLQINYELMVRMQQPELVRQARVIFADALRHCRRIDFEEWRKSRTVWQKLKQRLAYLLLVRIDPFVARWQWSALPD